MGGRCRDKRARTAEQKRDESPGRCLKENRAVSAYQYDSMFCNIFEGQTSMRPPENRWSSLPITFATLEASPPRCRPLGFELIPPRCQAITCAYASTGYFDNTSHRDVNSFGVFNRRDRVGDKTCPVRLRPDDVDNDVTTTKITRTAHETPTATVILSLFHFTRIRLETLAHRAPYKRTASRKDTAAAAAAAETRAPDAALVSDWPPPAAFDKRKPTPCACRGLRR
ncbi:hypothetical protein EVAR_878_1 [Eumeta japonica]|uniref:Uncharacterized protein n=1 Tax=Eumeta variegata TaxID=151549 RepID=A0A4C1SDU4_EUMVA|nr:hypothetical protein EVAR_878_1 [Eumeta japonica]